MPPANEDSDAQLLKEYEALMAMMEGSGQAAALPQELQELMANVKRAKGQQAAEQQASAEVTPQPGYVIKTSDDKDRKVFINICHCTQVPAPASWAQGMAPDKVMKALEDLQQDTHNADTEAMRFAISVSELQQDTDKQGQACVTVDCLVNSDVMKGVQQSRPLKAFVNELVVGWVGQKHGLTLDPKYKLPKMTYKGDTIRSQRVKLDPKPLVSLMHEGKGGEDDDEAPSFALVPSKAAAAAKKAKQQKAAAAAAGAAAVTAAASSSTTTSISWQHDVKCEGHPVTHMVASVQLPAPSSSSSSSCWPAEAVHVQLCGTQLKVQLDPQQQQQQQGPSALCIHLPFAASSDGAEAQLCGSRGQQLVVRLPYLPLQQWVQQLQAEAPQPFSQLPVAHQAYMELDG